MSRLPTIFTLKALLRYDPETGKLFWRRREPSQFRPTVRRSPEHACAQFNSRFADKEAFTANRNGYLCGAVDYSLQYAHRVIWAIQTGEWPIEVDHINGDRTDNRWANLRAVTRSDQNLNMTRRKDNTSGVLGVGRKAGRWRARIRKDGVQEYLGSFDTVEEAAEVRREAEVKHGFHPNHGRLARGMKTR